jgi:ornithine decarboxylase
MVEVSSLSSLSISNKSDLYADVEPITVDSSIPALMRAKAAVSETYDPFYVIDLGQVLRKHEQWRSSLPRVQPFYAVKCNSDEKIVRLLAALGSNFDCASKAEMQQVLGFGVHPDRIIYAHPCKQTSHVRFAFDNGVKMMTFDNDHELIKMKQLYPDAKLVLRILSPNARCVSNLGLKFGASIDRVPFLLKVGKELDLNIVGISFHVGSGCFDAQPFADAVHLAKRAFEMGKEAGYTFTLLDVGGGFPGTDNESVKFSEIVSVLRPALDSDFPESEYPDLKIIAEPGRYYVAASHTLAVNVYSKRTVPPATDDAEPKFMYYVNDGVYGSFNCIMFDHAVVKPRILCRGNLGMVAADSDTESDSEGSESSRFRGFECSIWGPTCDSMDCITKDARLPELSMGDWLYFSDMGAYTIAAASTFNGFARPRVMYVNSEAHRS